jgi:aryl-alcohol dehydrogenase-like predicted oxidoreductase
MKIGLGTVQFGYDYGISNQNGKTPPNEIKKLLRYISQKKIKILDTAALYGDSESVLGEVIPNRHGFHIVTKTPVFKKQLLVKKDFQLLSEAFHHSLLNLKQSRIYGLLIHHAEDLLMPGSEGLFEQMQTLKQKKMVKKIGVSVYTVEETERILEKFPIDLIQLPMNLLDQRFLKSGTLKKLALQNIEIHVRSAFLQGLLLMQLDQISAFFKPILPILQEYHNLLIEKGLSLVEGALCFLRQQLEISTVLIGVTDLGQLQENILAFEHCNQIDLDFRCFAVEQENMINPSLWDLK